MRKDRTAPTTMPMISAITILPNNEFRNLTTAFSSVEDELRGSRITVSTGKISDVMTHIRKPI